MCGTNNTFLEWAIKFPQYESLCTYLFIYGLSFRVKNIRKYITITCTKTSERGLIPLMSTVTIDNVSNDLNGTVINCTGLSYSVRERISVTVIHVYGKIIYIS